MPGVRPPAQGCQTSGRQRFVITGRGGLPPSPSELAAAARIILMPPSPPVEAQGWIINAKEEVELVANSAVVVPYSPGGAPICN
jgi:large exoprotein involved in heme utilization and adhesion